MSPIKKDLLADLSHALEQLSPGAGDKAAFESPKVAAHGDLACTAAMQLSKALKQNPRELAERLNAKVQVQHGRGGRGKLVIQYHGLEVLDGILEKIRGNAG